jgi:hypothetical protein
MDLCFGFLERHFFTCTKNKVDLSFSQAMKFFGSMKCRGLIVDEAFPKVRFNFSLKRGF